MMLDMKQAAARWLEQEGQAAISEGMELAGLLEYPPDPQMGDVSLPCFKLSKLLRKAPQAIAQQIKEELDKRPDPAFERVEPAGGYVNFYINRAYFAEQVIGAVLTAKERFGAASIGAGKTVVIDYSSPNIAKPFHVGHLRSTVIGRALYNIHGFLGYRVVGINHLGDWGTQFGKQIAAFKHWGDEQKVEQDGISELLRLYVKFHEEAERDPALDEEARAWFVKLEAGDEEAVRLWAWFKQISYQQFNKIYGLLGVTFDSDAGESFYNDKMDDAVNELRAKELLEEDDGAMLVRLDDYGMPPALILKKDGATLYHTRDIAAALYRYRTYEPEKILYVTSYAQNLHFKQWFKVIELMGCDWADKLTHVPFGQVSMEGESFSTRRGNVVLLEQIIDQAIAKIADIIEAKNPQLENKETVAQQVGVGAVVFNDVSNNRIKDISFSWETALNFEGETGPYVQYTYARASSVLRKAEAAAGQAVEYAVPDGALLAEPEAVQLIKELYWFPEKIRQAEAKLEPSIISRHLIDIAQSFNRFYHEHPILLEDLQLRAARLSLVAAVRTTLAVGLGLIGLETPERM